MLRGLVADWPLVRAARNRAQAAIDLPARLLPRRAPVVAMLGAPGHRRALLLQRRSERLQFQAACGCSSTRVLDETARDSRRRRRRRRSTSAPPPSTPACRAFAPRTTSTSAARQRAGQHLDRQPHAHRRAPRPARQPRLRGRRASPLHAVSARAARRTSTSGRSTSRRPGSRSAWSISRSPTSRASRVSPRRWSMRTSPSSAPGDAHLHSRACGGTTSRRSTPSTCWSTTGGASRRRTWTRR